MTFTTDRIKRTKEQLGQNAAGRIQSGMVVGLGSGSTAAEFIHALGRRIRSGDLDNLRAVATSFQSTLIAREHGIPVFPIDAFEQIDVVVDGADEVDPQSNLIKGGGGAHTLEKIVASMARVLIIVVDSRKMVERLGTTCPVPIEVVPVAYGSVLRAVRELGGIPELRTGAGKAGPVISDLGNFLIDARFAGISSPSELEVQLNNLPGVVDNGIFAGMADLVLVGELEDREPSVTERVVGG